MNSPFIRPIHRALLQSPAPRQLAIRAADGPNRMSSLPMIFRARLIAPFALLLMLAACGGDAGSTATGGSSPNGGAGSGGSGGSGGSSGAAAGVVYESAPNPTSPADLLAQLNTQGANGYAWVNPIALPGDAGAEFALYAKAATATYTYEVLAMPGTLSDTLTQANAEGARGFARVSPVMAGLSSGGIPNEVIIYRHTVGSSAVYTYESLTPPTTDADFLAQANAEGARGFFFNSVAAEPGPLTAAFYGKDSSSTAIYAYTTQPLNGSSEAFLAQANAQGALGYLFFSAYFFNGQTSTIYVKDTTQSARFVVSDQPAVTHTSDYVSQANAQGNNGLRLTGELQFGSTPQVFYVLPQNCTGLLCTPWGPF